MARGLLIKKVCYSFWVLSSLSILNKIPWIDEEKLMEFILSAQDLEDGGIADRPGDMADVFHTNFGVAGKRLISAVLLTTLGNPSAFQVFPSWVIRDLWI